MDLPDSPADTSGLGLPADESHVRLYPPEATSPRSARIPSTQSQRWRSPFEASGAVPATLIFVTQQAFLGEGEKACAVAGVLCGKDRLHNDKGRSAGSVHPPLAR